jgi:hypothetical protein
MPPFQIGESRSASNSSFQTVNLNLLRSDTREAIPLRQAEAYLDCPRSNASRLSPISDLRAAGRHRRASQLNNRLKGVVARHTVS